MIKAEREGLITAKHSFTYCMKDHIIEKKTMFASSRPLSTPEKLGRLLPHCGRNGQLCSHLILNGNKEHDANLQTVHDMDDRMMIPLGVSHEMARIIVAMMRST
jgi:hypothetical protein